MFVVGLTGGIGSGKSTVADQFGELGIVLVDADQLSREAVVPGSPALAAIAERYGEEILTESGELRRRTLREIVFADSSERHWLESLLHPTIHSLIENALRQAHSPYCILVSPLLLETRQVELVDRVLVVDVPETAQLVRTIERDGGDRSTIEAIIASQTSRDKRLSKADDVLDNSLPLATLPARVQALHQQYVQLSRDTV